MSAAPEQQGQLVVQLASVLRQVPVYDLSNGIFASAVPALVATVNALSGEGELLVDLAADSFFLNKSLIRLQQGSFEAAELLKKLFTRFGVQQLRFPAGCTTAQVLDFLALVKKHGQTQTPRNILQEPPAPVRFATVTYALGGVGSIDARQNVLHAYARLAALLEAAITEAGAGRPFRSPLLRKTVQHLVQASEQYDSLLAGLTRFPNFSGKPHFHLAAVAALTLLMARRLQLPRALLVDVVVAAALHELDGPRAPGLTFVSGTAPFASMVTAVRDAWTTDTLLQATAAFESHSMVMHDDIWAPGPLGRLLAVPCAFDRMTSGQGEQRYAPDQAMRSISNSAGLRFDARVVRLFTATLGVYPIGSAVRLDSGETAIVLEVPREARAYARPVVKIIRNEHGPCDQVVDLGADPQQRQVVASVDAVQEDLNPTAFLLA